MNQTKSIDKIVVELFGGHLEPFRRHLSEQGHAESTVKRYEWWIAQLAAAMKEHGVPLAALDETQAAALVLKVCRNRKKRRYASSIAKRFVRFLSERGAGKLPVPRAPKEIARAALKRDYETYLRRQRGLSERTIFHSWRVADRFLEFRFGAEVGDLERITAADIADFLRHLTTRARPFRDKTPATHLRNFFRYLFKAGKTAVDLSLSVPRVAQRYAARLPHHLAPEQIDALIRAVRSDTPKGRRNYAMLMLLARLGLRAPEVIAMQWYAARVAGMTVFRCHPTWARLWPITSVTAASRQRARCS
jgi:site-specific recombinase XerD